MIRSQPEGYIGIAILEQWIIKISLPELTRRREFHGYDGRAVLILDNCSSHRVERFHALCRENNVFPLFVPPHTSNQFQPLDLTLWPHEAIAHPREPHGGFEHPEATRGASGVCSYRPRFRPM
jgi:hypothetical protein